MIDWTEEAKEMMRRHRIRQSLVANGLIQNLTNVVSNTAPIAVADSFSVNEGDTYLGVLSNGLLANDTDADGDTLTLTHINGVALASGADQGSGVYRHITAGTAYVDVDADGEFGYRPGDQTLSDSFNYTISDGNGGTAVGSVSVTINGVYDLDDTAITIRSTDNPDLIPDPDFSDNITGWVEGKTPVTSLGHDPVLDALDVVYGAGYSIPSISIPVATVAGRQYTVSADIDYLENSISTYAMLATSVTDWNTGRTDLWNNTVNNTVTVTAGHTNSHLHICGGQTFSTERTMRFNSVSVKEAVAKGNALSSTLLEGTGTITAFSGATLVGEYWEHNDYDLWVERTTGEFFYNTGDMPHTQNFDFTRNGQSGRVVLTSPDVAAPVYQIVMSQTLAIDDYLSGTTIGRVSSDMVGTISFSIVDADGLAIELSGDTISTTGAIVAGDYDVVMNVSNTLGATHNQTIMIRVNTAAVGVYRGQHTPAQRPGPTGVEGSFTAVDGTVLHPTGTGVYRFVDGTVGSSGDGLSLANALKTVQEGFNAAQAGDTILINSGYYPETPTKVYGSNQGTETDRIKISRLGTSEVQIGGGDLVGGWTSCVNGDAKSNPNYASMYKTTIPDTWAIDLVGCVLQQAGQMAFIRVTAEGYTSTADMFSRNDTPKFYEAGVGDATDLTENKVGDDITFTSATIFGGYAQGDLDDASIMMLHAQGNNTILEPITAHNAAAGTAVIDVGSLFTFNDKLAIINSVKDIDEAGQWGYEHDAGNNEYILYFYPYDTGAMDNIRLSARTSAIICQDADNWTFYGIGMHDAGGVTHNEGYGFRSAQPGIEIHNVIIRECVASRNCNSLNVGRGMFFDDFKDLTLENNTIEFIQDGGGFNLTGCSGYAQYNLLQNIAGNAWGNAQDDGLVIAYNEWGPVRSAHGNGMSIYLGCQNVLVWGNIFNTVQGICLTFQESNNIYIGMNLFVAPQDEPQHRTIDNNAFQVPNERRYTDQFILDGDIVIANNTSLPWIGAVLGDEGTGVAYGQTPSATHHMLNNVSFGNYTRAHDGTYFLTLSDTTLTAHEPPDVTSNQTAVGAQQVFTTSGTAEALYSTHDIDVEVNAVSVPFTLTQEYNPDTPSSIVTLDTPAADGDAVVITATGQDYKSSKGTLNGNIFVSDVSAGTLAELDGSTKATVISDVWEDLEIGAYRPKTGGPLDTTGTNCLNLFPTGEAWCANHDFTKDAYGQSFDWATTVPIGALVAA